MGNLDRIGFAAVVAILLCFASCAKRDPSRFFRTVTVSEAADAPAGLAALILWPADRARSPDEIAALADPLIDLDPAWGQYTGVGQQRVDSGPLENRLNLSLSSLGSIKSLKTFCDQHYPGALVLIYCDADDLFPMITIEDLLRDYSDKEDGVAKPSGL